MKYGTSLVHVSNKSSNVLTHLCHICGQITFQLLFPLVFIGHRFTCNRFGNNSSPIYWTN